MLKVSERISGLQSQDRRRFRKLQLPHQSSQKR